MPRPIHFEIHAADLPATMEFYAAVFGWTFEDYSDYTGHPYFGIVTGDDDEPGINGAILARPTEFEGVGAPVNGAVLTMGVESFDDVADKVLAAGGRVALPKHALPGMAWQGYFLDVDGNVFGIHQPDTEAA